MSNVEMKVSIISIDWPVGEKSAKSDAFNISFVTTDIGAISVGGFQKFGIDWCIVPYQVEFGIGVIVCHEVTLLAWSRGEDQFAKFEGALRQIVDCSQSWSNFDITIVEGAERLVAISPNGDSVVFTYETAGFRIAWRAVQVQLVAVCIVYFEYLCQPLQFTSQRLIYLSSSCSRQFSTRQLTGPRSSAVSFRWSVGCSRWIRRSMGIVLYPMVINAVSVCFELFQAKFDAVCLEPVKYRIDEWLWIP